MNLQREIENKVNSYAIEHGKDPVYIILDTGSYFMLKEQQFGSTELAVEMELEEYMGIKLCFNIFGRFYLDVAG